MTSVPAVAYSPHSLWLEDGFVHVVSTLQVLRVIHVWLVRRGVARRGSGVVPDPAATQTPPRRRHTTIGHSSRMALHKVLHIVY